MNIIYLYKLERIIIFGSYANWIAKKDSSIDLCVIFDYVDKRNALMMCL